MNEAKGRQFYGIDDFAREVGAHPHLIADEVERGRIKVQRSGSHGQFRAIPADEVQAYTERRHADEEAKRQAASGPSPRETIAVKHAERVERENDPRAKDAARLLELHSEAAEILARHGVKVR